MLLSAGLLLVLAGACSKSTDDGGQSLVQVGGGSTATGGSDGNTAGSAGLRSNTAGAPLIDTDGGTCTKKTCADLGWACGYSVDKCGNVTDCTAEGLACANNEVCIGGVNGQPTKCVAGGGQACELCNAIPDCSKAGSVTHLTGRVVTPGRDDSNVANQVGVPNAIVYILQTDKVADLPAISSGIPSGGTSCDRWRGSRLRPGLERRRHGRDGSFHAR